MQTRTLGIHQGTYDAVFQHPVARNLQWRALRSVLISMADVTEEHGGGRVKFTRNGKTLTVHPPKRKDFSDVQDLMQIRQFLERSGAPVGAGPFAVESLGSPSPPHRPRPARRQPPGSPRAIFHENG